MSRVDAYQTYQNQYYGKSFPEKTGWFRRQKTPPGHVQKRPA